MDMSKMLGKKVEDAVPEPLLPRGMWKFLILKSKGVQSSKKGTPGVEFTLRPIEPGPDVDPTDRDAYFAQLQTGNYKFDDVTKTDQFWISDNQYTLVRLRQFIEKAGVNITGRTFEECIPDTNGLQIWGTVVWEPIEGRPGDFRDKIGSYHSLSEA